MRGDIEKIGDFQPISRFISETVQDRERERSLTGSCTRFQLIPKSTTLDDLERSYRNLLHKICVFRTSEHTTKSWKNIDPCYYYQRQNVGSPEKPAPLIRACSAHMLWSQGCILLQTSSEYRYASL